MDVANLKVPQQIANEAYQDFAAICQKYERRGLEPVLVLALLSNMIGKVIARQDPKRFTKKQLLEVVTNNIEQGNQEMVRSDLGGLVKFGNA